MSLLASLSGKTAWDEEILGRINDALMQLQVDALGRRADFGYSSKDIESSCQILAEFLDLLRKFLIEAGDHYVLVPKTLEESAAKNIVVKLEETGKPRPDWIEDLDSTLAALRSSNAMLESNWAVLEDVVDVLDEELAEDLRELSLY